MEKVKILLADDHPLIRSGISNLLQSYKDFIIVGEASNGEEAIEKTKELSPDIVIIDISMPVLSGIEATKIIRKKYPTTRVLVLTMHENEEYVYQIFKSGAGGYVLKNTGKDELSAAIRSVIRGEKFFSPRISELMLNGYLRKATEREAKPVATPDIPLTNREKEILPLIAHGMTNQEIAEKLFISPRTVDTHRTNMMQKLDIHDVVTLVRYALDRGFIPKKSER